MKENLSIGESEKIVVERRQKCTGIIVQRTTGRGSCVMCKRQTFHFCVGCRMYCCAGGVHEKVSDSKEVVLSIPHSSGREKDTTKMKVKNTCAMEMHMGAILQNGVASNK